LLWVLALLEPSECELATMDGGWSPKTLLAHVAFWDEVQCRRMERALAGDSAGLWRPRESNDARAASDAARPLADVLAAAEAARARMAAFAESVPAAELTRDLPEGDRTLRLDVLLEHMVEHTERHRRDLFTWCGSPARWRRADLRALIDRHHTLLLESVAGLSEAQILSTRTETGWSMRDELVHLLAWSEYGVRVMDGWPQVAPEAIADYVSGEAKSEDEVNAGLLAARADMNMIEIADQLATFHRRTLNRFDALDDEALASHGDYGWGESGPQAGLLYRLALHQAEHAEALWRARPPVA
jgi:uncharacterized damage-inducible protein DinB